MRLPILLFLITLVVGCLEREYPPERYAQHQDSDSTIIRLTVDEQGYVNSRLALIQEEFKADCGTDSVRHQFNESLIRLLEFSDSLQSYLVRQSDPMYLVLVGDNPNKPLRGQWTGWTLYEHLSEVESTFRELHPNQDPIYELGEFDVGPGKVPWIILNFFRVDDQLTKLRLNQIESVARMALIESSMVCH